MITRVLALAYVLVGSLNLAAQSDTTFILEQLQSKQVGPGERTVQMYHNATKPDKIRSSYFEQTFQQHSLTQILDNYNDDAHVHLETTADYDKANPYLIAFTGASYKWTKYYYDGIRINNPLIAGDAAHRFPMIGADLETDGVAGTIAINPYQEQSRSINVRGVSGNHGGRVGFTDWFLNNISGHRSAAERSIFDIQQRPYTSWHSEINYVDNSGQSPLTISIFGGDRIHVDQDYAGANTSYHEEYLNMMAAGRLLSKKHILGDGVNYIFSYSEREHAGAEFQYSEAETSKLVQLNTDIYTKKELANGNQTFGVSLNLLRKAKVDANFSRNYIDQDGEGFYPYEQDGRQFSLGFSYSRNENIAEKLSYSLEANNNFIRHNPQTESWTNGIFRQSTDDDYLSLHMIKWSNAAFSSALLENNATINYQNSTAHQALSITGGLHLYGMLISENSMLNIAPSLDFRWQSGLQSKWRLGVKAGFHPNRYDIQQLRLLAPEHLNGEAYAWDDRNGDRQPTADEKGELLYTTGSRSHVKSDDLGVSNTVYLEIPITYKPSQNWEWSIIPQYRQYRNVWTMEYAEPISEVGSFVPLGEQELFVPDAGRSLYEIRPLSKERMNSRDRESELFLFDQPYYGALVFRFQHDSYRWFFSGSMIANMSVGYAGLGNGPLHNNINAASETTANPNTRRNQVGRLDSDRSFISRIVATYKYSKAGAVGLTLKYKDGQSFAFYDHYIHPTAEGNRIAVFQPEVRGDNPLTGVMGRREDFFTNFELHGQHTFHVGNGQLRVRATLHNLLDFANETSEYIFGNVEGFSRSPLELQVPRSFSLDLQYMW